MASTYFDTSNALVRKAWDEKLFRDVEKSIYFKRFMGNSPESLVYVRSMLEKEAGDKITFGLRMRLVGAGVSGSGVLEGNEEILSVYDSSVTLEQYRHAVRVKKGISQQRIPWSLMDEAKSAIQIWAAEKVDALCFSALQTAATKVFYREASAGAFTGTTAFSTAVAALSSAANQKITPGFISQLRTWAKTGGNRTYVPLRPIRDQGRDVYILLIHEDAAYDLKVDSTYAQAQRDAQERGKDNPIFTGALGVWDNVVVHAHESVTVGGTTHPYSYGTLMGAQALCFAWGVKPRTVIRDFDYDVELGVAADFTLGVTKPQFNSKDFGSLGVVVYRSNVSGQ